MKNVQWINATLVLVLAGLNGCSETSLLMPQETDQTAAERRKDAESQAVVPVNTVQTSNITDTTATSGDDNISSSGTTTDTGSDANASSENEPATELPDETVDPLVPPVVETPPIGLALYNTMIGDIASGFDPLPSVLNRVEMPPRFSVVAIPPAGTTRVRFELDGQVIATDNAAPFRLSESAAGDVTSWDVTDGAHTLKVYSFVGDSDHASGTQHVDIEISSRGKVFGFEKLSAEENMSQLNATIEQDLEAKVMTSDGRTLHYRVFKPRGYDPAVNYPVVLYLHGRGNRGSDNDPWVYKSSGFLSGENALISPNNQHDFPAFVLVPQCPLTPIHHEWTRWYGNSEDNEFGGLTAEGEYTQHDDPWYSAPMVLALIDGLARDYSVDEKRVYIHGASMGGMGTWDYITRWPERFAAAVPFAGLSDRSTASNAVDVPVWVFHGRNDPYNQFVGSEQMVQALQAAGGNVRYTWYDDKGHGDAFEQAWAQEPDLLPWIFSQRKP